MTPERMIIVGASLWLAGMLTILAASAIELVVRGDPGFTAPMVVVGAVICIAGIVIWIRWRLVEHNNFWNRNR